MKGTYQIYLFAATLLVAIGFFIQRSFRGPSSLYATEIDVAFEWEVRHFDEALFGGDSLDMKELATYFNPFFEFNAIPNFWKQERANPTLRDHYTNVQNLMNKEAIAEDLNAVSGRAKELLGAPKPKALYFYLSLIHI